MKLVRFWVSANRTSPSWKSFRMEVSFRQTVMMCLSVTMMPRGRVEYTTASSFSTAGTSMMIREVSSSSRAARRKEGSTPNVTATVFSSSSLG